MAQVTKETEKTRIVTDRTFHLELNSREAVALAIVLRSIGGDSDHSERETTAGILDELEKHMDTSVLFEAGYRSDLKRDRTLVFNRKMAEEVIEAAIEDDEDELPF